MTLADRIGPRSALLTAALLVGGLVLGAIAVRELGARPPNVLVVVLDDVGIDKMRAYADGTLMPRTPVIDGLAAQGVVFRNAWAMPACSPTRAAALTGRFARRTGVGSMIDMWQTPSGLALEEVTIAEAVALAPRPYVSAAIGKWHLVSRLEPDYLRNPNHQGFRVFSGSIGNLTYSHQAAETRSYERWERVDNGVATFTRRYATSVNVDDALAFITRARRRPWFVWLAFNAPHTPVHRPPDDLVPGGFEKDPEHPVASRMNAMLEAADTELGRLLDSLPPKVRANTVVLVVGDNGTEKMWTLPPQRPDRHKTTVYEGGVRVPLIVAGPAVGRPGVSQALVHVVDIFATVVELAGVDPEGLRGADGGPLVLDGQSLVPYLRDPETPGRREVLYTEQFYPNGRIRRPDANRWENTEFNRAAVWDGARKVIQFPTGYGYFHLTPDAIDEGEPLDLAAIDEDERRRFAALRKRLLGIQADLQGWRPLDLDAP